MQGFERVRLAASDGRVRCLHAQQSTRGHGIVGAFDADRDALAGGLPLLGLLLVAGCKAGAQPTPSPRTNATIPSSIAVSIIGNSPLPRKRFEFGQCEIEAPRLLRTRRSSAER